MSRELSAKKRAEAARTDPAAPEPIAGSTDWDELFAAEMRSRRERLQYWMRLIHEAVDPSKMPRKPVQPCRGRVWRRDAVGGG